MKVRVCDVCMKDRIVKLGFISRGMNLGGHDSRVDLCKAHKDTTFGHTAKREQYIAAREAAQNGYNRIRDVIIG